MAIIITRRHYTIYPELKYLESDAERLACLSEIMRRLSQRKSHWLLLLGILLIIAVVFGAVQFARASTRWVGAVVFNVMVIAGAIQYSWRKPARRMLREHLIAKGVRICLHCGYDLRGQTEPRCPECGRPFSETLLEKKNES